MPNSLPLMIIVFAALAADPVQTPEAKAQTPSETSSRNLPAIKAPDPNEPPLIKLQLIPKDRKFSKTQMPGIILRSNPVPAPLHND